MGTAPLSPLAQDYVVEAMDRIRRVAVPLLVARVAHRGGGVGQVVRALVLGEEERRPGLRDAFTEVVGVGRSAVVVVFLFFVGVGRGLGRLGFALLDLGLRLGGGLEGLGAGLLGVGGGHLRGRGDGLVTGLLGRFLGLLRIFLGALGFLGRDLGFDLPLVGVGLGLRLGELALGRRPFGRGLDQLLARGRLLRVALGRLRRGSLARLGVFVVVRHRSALESHSAGAGPSTMPCSAGWASSPWSSSWKWG